MVNGMKNRGLQKGCLLLCFVILVSISVLGCASSSRGGETAVRTQDLRIATTSTSIMKICEELNIELVGVPQSSLVEIPECYADATVVGSPMSPDLEILATLDLDWVLSPATLMSDLQPQYEAAGLTYAFVNLKSITGMFKSIEEMGVLFDREEEASVLLEEFQSYYNSYQEKNEGTQGPRVLVLMGLPGSYVVATENSYVGSLVELAGGVNVYAGTDEEFLNVNTEDMLQQNPDIILRAVHAMPEDVLAMFEEEFETNDIWKHFHAVQEGQVYDCPTDYFGMSATFDYQEGLEWLDEVLYANSEEHNE